MLSIKNLISAFLVLGIANSSFAAEAPITFADLVEKTSPAVVSIASTQTVERKQKSFFNDMPDNPYDMFEFFENELNPNQEKQKASSLGSGFIIDPKGYVVTNYHVVENSDQVLVSLEGEGAKHYKAKIVGKDKKTDLALLKIEADKDLPYLEFGDLEKSRVGDWVVTIGNPYNLGGTVTKGIISAKSRYLTGQFDDFIQTDASINKGNSGGPMLNMEGKVIGVNTVILSPSGGSIGIGFAVPSSVVKNVVNQLRENGEVKRSWLGVKIQPVDDDIAKSMGLEKVKGALVAEVTPDSPASKAGMKVGDIITKFDSNEVSSNRKLPVMVSGTPAGKEVILEVFRDAKYHTIKAVVESYPNEDDGEVAAESNPNLRKEYASIDGLGITVRDLDQGLRKKYRIPTETKGVLVIKVDIESGAASKVRAGDVILKINQDNIEKLEDFNEAVAKVKEKGDQSVVMLVSTLGQTHFVVVDLS